MVLYFLQLHYMYRKHFILHNDINVIITLFLHNSLCYHYSLQKIPTFLARVPTHYVGTVTLVRGFTGSPVGTWRITYCYKKNTVLTQTNVQSKLKFENYNDFVHDINKKCFGLNCIE